MGALKHIGGVAWCVGIAVFIGLILWSGYREVGSALISVGWGLLFVVLTRIATVSVAGAGWWTLLPAPNSGKVADRCFHQVRTRSGE